MPSFDKVDGNFGYYEESLSEEALKLLQYRQKLKDQHRSKLRQENGTSLSISLDEMKKPASKKQKSSACHVLDKKNGTSSQPPLNKVKTKAQTLKNMRDYSVLSSDDAEVPKPMNDPKQQNILVPKPDGRSIHVPAKSIKPLVDSARKVFNANVKKQLSESLQVCNTCIAPPRKPISGTASSIGGTKPVRPTMSKALPRTKSLSPRGKKVPQLHVGPVEHKVPPAPKYSMFNGQKQTSGVSKNLEHKRDIRHRNDSSVLKKENPGACKLQNKLPKRSSDQANLEDSPIKKQKSDRKILHKYSGGINKDQSKKDRRAEQALSDDDCDLSSILQKLSSAKIVKREDEVELAKILEEERQQRRRKEAKLRKMSR